ncbi:MAG: error-prone DNA polymerase [Cellvibrionaceae bacterium]|nr:error-prone DNA polymerase [Cellvibrionaceae bacterium]
MFYAQLNTTTNFSFLRGASHPQEYVDRAISLGYRGLAITDECSLAGVVKAFQRHRDHLAKGLPKQAFKLIYGSVFRLESGPKIIALAPSRQAYAEISGLITLARRRTTKGKYQVQLQDLPFRLQHCLLILLADEHGNPQAKAIFDAGESLQSVFRSRLWLGINQQLLGGEQSRLVQWQQLAQRLDIPLVASGKALMHEAARKPLQDVLCAIRENTSVQALGSRLQPNAEAHLKPLADLNNLYPPEYLQNTQEIAEQCQFCLSELQYQYPKHIVPANFTASSYLRYLSNQGKQKRYPGGLSAKVEALLNKELSIIEQLGYEYFFITVYDIVCFARKNNIFYQGRGSAANSVLCYCLYITNISPEQINVLFERFVSKERDEPPDIDVDFEHHRREEVIQYVYSKYGREHAAIAATVVTYRSRSAIRDVGKALGIDASLIDHLAKSLAWWDRSKDLQQRIEAAGLNAQSRLLLTFFDLVQQILGFPRHLSQHVGGFVITRDRISDLVPTENASMPGRTVIQWDKDDLETMNLLKVDILALGMLTALHKACDYVNSYDKSIQLIEDIPTEDPDTYEMLCAGDSVGVFQVESRAQMSMLPRLRPRTFYDLVIEIAIVRPGPIQGDMVHPYLRRRNGEEPTQYFNDAIKSVLEKTNGIPIFQEQAIRLSMVAAGFSGGEADALRRAMASWGKNGNLLLFEERFIQGMLANNYPLDFAQRLFEQIKGFGGYGFPESHSASFALLCYASSWLKCHHPAAFYCALLNSQPMGFYSASQLVQDAKRHEIVVLPVDINVSEYENRIEQVAPPNAGKHSWGLRLGFCRIKSLNREKAEKIDLYRGNQAFTSIHDLLRRTQLSPADIQYLAAADALQSIAGDRHSAHWQTASIKPRSELLGPIDSVSNDTLVMPEPSEEKNVVDDYSTTGLSLRQHPMALLRRVSPFDRCKKQSELLGLNHGRFVRIAGLVTGRQRPQTAKGTLFITLEDETGNINVVVRKNTQEQFRQALLTAKLLLVKGVLELSRDQNNPQYTVIHIVAGELIDYSQALEENFVLQSRDFH